jgi:cation:H+ antiporter
LRDTVGSCSLTTPLHQLQSLFKLERGTPAVEVLLALAALIVSLVLLNKGADWLVEGASSLATIARVSPLIIGLTIVAFGTSLPELSVSVTASLEGDAGISVGNVVGSNIANILLILGISTIVSPVACSSRFRTRDSLAMLASAVLLVVLSADGGLGRVDAAILLLAFSAYMVHFTWQAKQQREEARHLPVPEDTEGRGVSSVKTVGGLVLVLVSSVVLVTTASFIAREVNVPTEIIGLSIVAIGTSIPELATSVVAAREGKADISIGNVVGSNIFNTLLVLGAAAAIRGLAVESFMWLDMAIMLGVSAAMIPVLRSGLRLGRREGVVMLAGYALYMAYVLTYGDIA